MNSESVRSDAAITSGDSAQTIPMSEAAPGASIGKYRIVRQAGEGGMGVVFHAYQVEPFRRHVALKIIKPGMDSKQVIARFESERQSLAMMDHANIARVFDAGTTEAGLPYFVMELVDGVPITRYCDSKRLGVRERVELFIPVCQAIQHAHQKGIIHRDIKPSNILIAEQEGVASPKVIDFGLAKALGHELSGATMMTNPGVVAGTLDYMSPEQAELTKQDIDTRTDVYSLGAVLYELLAGATPLENLSGAAYVDALERIRREDTVPPSARLRRSKRSSEAAVERRSDPARLSTALRGELDWITMKALEKDRTRRYETASALARDLQRYLDGEPVEAGPPSAAYRLRKFAARHRFGLATAGALTALLVAGVIVSSWMAVRASIAERTARAVNDFLQNDLLAQASVSQQTRLDIKPDPDLKVRTVLERAAARIGSRFAAQAEIEASIRHTIGAAYFDLGLYADAARELERALAVRRRVLGTDHRDTLATMRQMAEVYKRRGRYSDAEALDGNVLAAERRSFGLDDAATLKTMDDLASVYLAEGKYREGETLGRDALARQERKLGQANTDTLSAMGVLASIYTQEGKYPEAEALFTKALGIQRARFGPDDPGAVSTMSDLSVLYSLEKRYAEAEALKIQVLDACRRLFGPEHPYTLQVMSNLAVSYSDSRKYAESEALNRQTLEILRRVVGPENPSTLIVMNNLGVAYKSQGKYVQAEAIDKELLATLRRVLPAGHPNTQASMSNLALDYLNLGEYGQAEALFREVLDARQRKSGPEDAGTLRTAYNLAWTLSSEGRYPESEKLLRQSLAIYQGKMPEDWERWRCQTLLGAVLSSQHKYKDAEPLLLDGVQGLLRHETDIAWYGRSDPNRGIEYLVSLYAAWSKPDKAAEWRSRLRARTAQRH